MLSWTNCTPTIPQAQTNPSSVLVFVFAILVVLGWFTHFFHFCHDMIHIASTPCSVLEPHLFFDTSPSSGPCYDRFVSPSSFLSRKDPTHSPLTHPVRVRSTSSILCTPVCQAPKAWRFTSRQCSVRMYFVWTSRLWPVMLCEFDLDERCCET